VESLSGKIRIQRFDQERQHGVQTLRSSFR
jgi:hypothetical protein